MYMKRLGQLNALCNYVCICLSGRICTLNLCLIDDKVLVVPTALQLLHMAAVKAHVLLLGLVEGEV